jgi:hypothetical protein
MGRRKKEEGRRKKEEGSSVINNVRWNLDGCYKN